MNTTNPENNSTKAGDKITRQGKKKKLFNNRKSWYTTTAINATGWREICKTHKQLMCRINQSGIIIKKYILDNKASEEFLQTIRKQGLECQKVPSHMHWKNAAEKQ